MKRFALALASLLFVGPAAAQISSGAVTAIVVSTCGAQSLGIGGPNLIYMDATGDVCIAGTFSASVSVTGFRPTAIGTPITAAVAGATGSLPAGATVTASNDNSSVSAYCALGASGSANAQLIPPKSTVAFAISGDTQMTCYTTTSTAVVKLVGGSGLATGWGGGGGGGGAGGAITAPLGHATADAAAVSVVPSATASFPVSAAALPLPTGASTSALQTTGNTALTTINTTLGTPMQTSGGSVTANAGTNLNTANIESYTSRLLSGAVPVAGGAATATTAQAVGGSYNSTPITLTNTQQAGLQLNSNGSLIVTGSVLNTGFNTLVGGNPESTANPHVVRIVDAGSNAATVTAGGNLNIQCANCSGSGVSTADEAAFSAGSSLFAGTGGFFQTTATSNALTNGQQGMFQATANRALFTNLRTAAGAETGIAGLPLQVSLANTGTNATPVSVNGSGAAGSAAAGVVTVQGITSMTPVQVSQATAASLNATVVGTGTFPVQAAITAASGSFSSGALASGSIASGALASGSIASGALAAGSIASGAAVSGAFVSGAIADLGLAQASTTSGQKGNMVLAAATTSAPTDTTGSSYPLSLTTTGGLRVDGAGGTFPATQSTAANLNATVVGTGTFATQSAITAASGSISSGSIASGALAAGSISSGAAVSGAFATGAIADLALAQGATTSGKVGNMILGAVTTGAPTYTTAQLDPLSLDTAGNLRVNCLSGCVGGSSSNASDAVATSSTNGQTLAFGYAFNGTTWDRLQDDGSKNLKVIDANSAALLTAAQAGTTTTGSAVTGSQVNMGVNSGGNSRQWTASNPTGSIYAGQVDMVAVNGTTLLAGAGAAAAGSPRVTVAQDTTTVAGAVPFSGATAAAVPANAAYQGLNVGGNTRGQTGVNPTGTVYAAQNDVASVAGTTASVGAGAVGNGTLRVAIGTDTGTIAGSAPSINLNNNIAQVNGVTTLAGTGAVGTGSIRVAVGTDTATIAGSAPSINLNNNIAQVNGHTVVEATTSGVQKVGVVGNAGAAFDAATGAAPPANEILTGTLGGGATGGHMNGLIQADSSAAITISSATTTQIIAAAASQKIYITSIDFVSSAADNLTIESGDTGGSCANPVAMTGLYTLAAQSGIAKGSGVGPILIVPAGKALCILTSTTGVIGGSVSYAQF